MLTDNREVTKCKNPQLSDYCKSKENCRRQLLLNAFCSSEVPSPSAPLCCDVCSPRPVCSTTADLFRLATTRCHARQVAVRKISSSQCTGLQRALLEERDVIVASYMGYRMLRKEVVLPTASIVTLCKQAINSEHNIQYPRTSRNFGGSPPWQH